MKQLLIFGTLFCLAYGSPAKAQKILFKAKRVITMAGMPLQPGVVLVADGKIVQVAEAIDVMEGVQVIDLGSAVVMPGLVNAYSQTGISGGASELTSEITPAVDVLAAIDWESRQFREALDEGVTSICLAPGTENVIAGLVAVIKTAGDHVDDRIVSEDDGLMITLASDPRDRNRSRSRPDSIYVRQPTNRMGVVWILRNTLHRAKTEPLPDDGILAEALNDRRQLFCVSRTKYDIESLLTIADEFGFTATIVDGRETYKIADRLSKRPWPVILGPLNTNLQSDVEGTDPVWNRAGALHDAGVPFALSGPGLLDQARFAVRFGLTRDAALRAITATPAQLLGISQRVGALLPGLDADLVVLSGDPLEFTTRVESVIVDGVIYHEGAKP